MPILADRVVSRFLASTTAVVFDEKKRRAVAEEALRLSLAKQQGKAMPAMTEDLVLWIKSGGPDTDVRRVMAEHAASTLTDAQLVEAFMGPSNRTVQVKSTDKKAPFYTPVSFRKLTEQVVKKLEKSTGIPWGKGFVDRSKQKTHAGLDESFMVKLSPSRQEPLSAELLVGKVTTPSGVSYYASLSGDHRFKPFCHTVLEDTKNFDDVLKWAAGLEILDHPVTPGEAYLVKKQ